MSLIADSLKKAVKEKSAPEWETDPKINPVGKRELVNRPGLSTVFRVLLLIVLPAAILGYLISIGAFALKKAPVAQKPDLPVSIPLEEARVSPPLKPAPEVLKEKPVAVPTAKVTKKTFVDEKTVALKPPDNPPARKKETTVFKKRVPAPLPDKKSIKPKKAIIAVPDVAPDATEVASSSLPDLKTEIPVVATVSPSVTEKKILAVPLARPIKKPLVEATKEDTPDVEPKAVVPEETSLLEAKIAEILEQKGFVNSKTPVSPRKETVLEKPQTFIELKSLAKPQTPDEPLSEPVLEKPEVSPGQETAVKITEKKILTVPLIAPTEKPLAEIKKEVMPDLEPKAVVPAEIPALKPEVAEIPEQKIAAKREAPASPIAEAVLGKSPASPAIPDAVKENAEKRIVEVQKENPEVALLPPSSRKPEISRVDPKDQENVFNSADYYFNRGIFFQQAGDWQKALKNYSRSEELDPNNPDTYNNKGVVLKEMGKYDKALDEFLRAVFLDASYAKAYNNIGVVYYMQKNYPEAIRHYLKAIDINPTNLEAFNNLAIIYKKQKESDKARGILNKALSLDPNHPGTNYNLAVLYEESSELKPALHFYRRFIELGAINYPSLVTQVKEHLEGMKPQ